MTGGCSLMTSLPSTAVVSLAAAFSVSRARAPANIASSQARFVAASGSLATAVSSAARISASLIPEYHTSMLSQRRR
jgi:hypothetical protein